LGVEWNPVVSPDGSAVAYTAGPIGETELFILDLGGGRPFALTEDRAGQQRWPRWTPDGRSIVFTEDPVRGGRAASLLIPRRGGPARTVHGPGVFDISSEHLVYRRGDSLLLGSIDGGGEVLLAPVDDRTHSATISPDGTLVAYVRGNLHSTNRSLMGNVGPSSVWVVAVNDGEPVRVADDSTSLNTSPVWMPDSRHLLFVSTRDGPRDIYAVGLDGSGRPRHRPARVTTGASPHSISVSADGKVLAYSRFTVRQNIWEVAIPAAGSVSIAEATPVTQGNEVIEYHGVSKDGRYLAFDANYEGNQDIYVMSLYEREPWRLTRDPGDDMAPDFSPDGREVAFYSHRRGDRDLFLIDTDGRGETQLTDGPALDFHPSFSPDGLRIAFSRREPSGDAVYLMRRDSLGGEWSDPQMVPTTHGGFYARWSPDGRRLTYHALNTTALWIVTLEGDKRRLLGWRDAGLTDLLWPDWSIDGRLVYFTAADSTGVRGLYAIPIEGGQPRVVVRFDDPSRNVGRLFAYTIIEGRALFTLSEFESDIWVVDLEW
jgi:Tol biopolymer transport system component